MRLREGGFRQLKARVAIVMVDGSNRISKMVPVKYLCSGRFVSVPPSRKISQQTFSIAV